MLSREQVVGWCAQLVDKTTGFPPLETCLAAIPALDSLSDLPAGTRVLVRCDTNVVVHPDGRLENDARLRSLLETLTFGRQRGWVQIIHGHVGTDGHQSLAPVVPHLGRMLQQDVTFIAEWMDDAKG